MNLDQRLFERYTSQFPVQFAQSGSGPENDIALKDFSAQGLSIRARKYLVPNESVSLEVDIPDGKASMQMEGVVVWSQPNNQEGWDTGIRLKDISLMHMSRIYRAHTAAQ